MFRNDLQKSRVCFILTAWVRGRHWEWDGQVYRPVERDMALSTGERKMLTFALALWASDDLPIWIGFDSRRWQDIATLLMAMGTGERGVDNWISDRSGHFHPSDENRARWENDVRTRARSA